MSQKLQESVRGLGVTVALNQAVTHVELQEPLVAEGRGSALVWGQQPPQQESAVILATAQGAQIRARRVVLALPPPVWSATITFSQPLPPHVHELGSGMFMGSTVKCGKWEGWLRRVPVW